MYYSNYCNFYWLIILSQMESEERWKKPFKFYWLYPNKIFLIISQQTDSIQCFSSLALFYLICQHGHQNNCVDLSMLSDFERKHASKKSTLEQLLPDNQTAAINFSLSDRAAYGILRETVR